MASTGTPRVLSHRRRGIGSATYKSIVNTRLAAGSVWHAGPVPPQGAGATTSADANGLPAPQHRVEHGCGTGSPNGGRSRPLSAVLHVISHSAPPCRRRTGPRTREPCRTAGRHEPPGADSDEMPGSEDSCRRWRPGCLLVRAARPLPESPDEPASARGPARRDDRADRSSPPRYDPEVHHRSSPEVHASGFSRSLGRTAPTSRHAPSETRALSLWKTVRICSSVPALDPDPGRRIGAENDSVGIRVEDDEQAGHRRRCRNVCGTSVGARDARLPWRRGAQRRVWRSATGQFVVDGEHLGDRVVLRRPAGHLRPP